MPLPLDSGQPHDRPAVCSSQLEAEPIEFLSISTAVLLHATTAPCDIYRRLGTDSFSLIAVKDFILSGSAKQFLQNLDGEELFIRKQDTSSYAVALAASFEPTAASASKTTAATAESLYTSCQELLRQSFSNPSLSFIQTVSSAVDTLLQTLLTDPVLTKSLLQLRAHDGETYTHSANAALIGLAFATRFQSLSLPELQSLGAGLFLHDLGKCQIPAAILNKPTKLSADERNIVEMHPTLGVELLKSCKYQDPLVHLITLQHHEKDNGTGYPAQRLAPDIHQLSRIARLADVYEALTSDRPYRPRMTPFEALKLMKTEICQDLDHQLFERFVWMFDAEPVQKQKLRREFSR